MTGPSKIERTARIGILAVGAYVVLYALFLAVFGSIHSALPESPGHSGAGTPFILEPAPIGPPALAFALGTVLLIGQLLDFRGNRYGLALTAAAALAITAFGAFLIFGAYGSFFVAGVLGLVLVVVVGLARIGRGRVVNP
jgi:hypothetical protein